MIQLNHMEQHQPEEEKNFWMMEADYFPALLFFEKKQWQHLG